MMKRIPLIKFRYGRSMNGLFTSPSANDIPTRIIDLPNTQSGLSQSIGMSSSSSTPVSKNRGPAVEFHQLPQRYRRPVISDQEMDIINNGGYD